MNADQRRAHRIMKLTQLAIKGRTESQLRHVCDQWGISDQTQNSYIRSVNARMEKRRRILNV